LARPFSGWSRGHEASIFCEFRRGNLRSPVSDAIPIISKREDGAGFGSFLRRPLEASMKLGSIRIGRRFMVWLAGLIQNDQLLIPF